MLMVVLEAPQLIFSVFVMHYYFFFVSTIPWSGEQSCQVYYIFTGVLNVNALVMP
jgi:hypothetical protein